MRCWIGWHAWYITRHHLGVRVPGVLNPAWDFDSRCSRCGKCRTQRYWLPPQERRLGEFTTNLEYRSGGVQ